MQLVAYGAQDIYLTGNPQITFFKVVYRRHTNFSMEAIEQTWNGSATSNGRCTATISRNGDLVHRMYLQVDATGGSNIDNPGADFITNVELEIGGQKIDKHSGDWMEAWAELTEPNPSGTVANQGKTATLFQLMSGMGGYNSNGGAASASVYTVPLQFWFCRNPGLALPLIALQYHEVKVILEHQIATSFATPSSHKLWADYIYLDTDERRRFAQVSHEYLIEQVQEQSWSATSQDLNFNHPVKELVWRQKSTSGGGASLGMAASGNWQLKLNGHDRFAARDARYFTRTQVWEHHSGAGGLDSQHTTEGAGAAGGTGGGAGLFNDSIAVYSFALKPEEHQPSGTCNFSRIDNAQLTCSGTPVADIVYAVNYNVLRIMSGMGGLAYSN
jgi:hypothetical protein